MRLGIAKSSSAAHNRNGMDIMQLLVMICMALLGQTPQSGPPVQSRTEGAANPEKSGYFAFVDHDYIFTVEVVAPGVPILNFVSMSEEQQILPAKGVRLILENRKAPAVFFLVDTGDPKEPVSMASLTMRPRSSFGVRIKGDFGTEKELLGVSIQVGTEDFRLAPLTSLAFESLVLKVNRINLGSPDFRDDWRALKLESLGSRGPAPRR